MIDLCSSLVLRARARSAHGDPAGALADLTVVQRLSDHLLETPSLITAMLACTLRNRVHGEVLRLLDGRKIDPAQAAEAVTPAREVTGAFLPALHLEEAYGLNAVGQLGGRGGELLGRGRAWSAPVAWLAEIFLLDPEVRSYRATLAQLRALVLGSGEAVPTDDLLSRGLWVRLLVPQIEGILERARRCDAMSLLVRAAVLATALHDTIGRYPTTLEELHDVAGPAEPSAAGFADVLLEPLADGGLRLTHPRFPPELEERDGRRIEVVLGGAQGR